MLFDCIYTDTVYMDNTYSIWKKDREKVIFGSREEDRELTRQSTQYYVTVSAPVWHFYTVQFLVSIGCWNVGWKFVSYGKNYYLGCVELHWWYNLFEIAQNQSINQSEMW